MALQARRLWRRPLDGHYFLGAMLYTVKDRIFFRRDSEDGRQPSIVCLDAEGNAVWERRFKKGTIDMLWASAEGLYLDGDRAQRLDPATGKTVVERDLGTRVTGGFPHARGIIYSVLESGKTFILDPGTLEEVWRWDQPEKLQSLHDPYLCVNRDDTSDPVVIELRDFESREVLRSFERPAGPRYHGHWQDLWVEFAGYERVAIDTRTGETVWRFVEADAELHAKPKYVGDIAYCGDNFGLSAFALSDGSLRWTSTVGGWVKSGPEIVGERIFRGTTRRADVIDRTSGAVLASIAVEEDPSAVRPLGDDRLVVGSLTQICCYELS